MIFLCIRCVAMDHGACVRARASVYEDAEEVPRRLYQRGAVEITSA